MSTNHFRPAHAAHAIIEQLIFFEFTPTLEHAIPALITLKDELQAEFPASEVLNTVRMQVSQQVGGRPEVAAPEINEAGGLRLNRFKPDGTPEMSINIEQGGIGLFCHDYTRWDEIWPIQKNYIKKIFSKIVHSQSFMTGIGMKWTDQFIYEGDPKAYDARELLREGSEYLHPRAFSSGHRWHCHTGWFDERVSSGPEVLNQLNLDAGLVNLLGSMRTAVTIDHTQLKRATQTPDELAPFVPTNPAGLDALSGLMDALHDGNKSVLRSLLSDSSLEMIALQPELAA